MTQGHPDPVNCRVNKTYGVSASETTGLFTASMIDNGSLI